MVIILQLNKKIVDLPVLKYSDTTVRVDVKVQKPSESKRGTVKVSVNKGRHNVEVSYKLKFTFFIGVVVALLSWLWISLKLIFKRAR